MVTLDQSTNAMQTVDFTKNDSMLHFILKVRAKNAAGNGTWSPEINVTDSCQDEVEPTVKPSGI